MSNKTWRCFHCDEVFGDKRDARLHFGETQEQTPVCQIDAREYRAMEFLVQKYREEDTDLHREISRMQSDYATALRRAEENGYESGSKAATNALAEVDRLNKKCAALALIAYGSPTPCATVYVFGVKRPIDSEPFYLSFTNQELAEKYASRCTAVTAVSLYASEKAPASPSTDSRGDAALWVLAWLATKGGLGHEVHDVIDAVMEGRAVMRPNNRLHIEPRPELNGNVQP